MPLSLTLCPFWMIQVIGKEGGGEGDQILLNTYLGEEKSYNCFLYLNSFQSFTKKFTSIRSLEKLNLKWEI